MLSRLQGLQVQWESVSKRLLWISINMIWIPCGQMNIAFEARFVKSNRNKTKPYQTTSQPTCWTRLGLLPFVRVVFAFEAAYLKLLCKRKPATGVFIVLNTGSGIAYKCLLHKLEKWIEAIS